MRKYLGLVLCLGIGVLPEAAIFAQSPYGERSTYDRRYDVPREQIPPQIAPREEPTLQRRVPVEQPQAGVNPQQAEPPFVLTPQEQAHVDNVLRAWEQRSSKVTAFECQFTRFYYDGVFGDPDKAVQDVGELKYAAPDKGLFSIKGQRPEQWICDGKSIFQYDYVNKTRIEHKLPPEMQGAAIADGPIPFLFGAKAEVLKARYFLKINAEQTNANQIWIIAVPKRLQEKQNFEFADVMLSPQTMLPTAIQLHDPNKKNRTTYVFQEPRINPVNVMKHIDPLKVFDSDPFHPKLPRDWTSKVEEPPAPAQVNASARESQMPRR